MKLFRIFMVFGALILAVQSSRASTVSPLHLFTGGADGSEPLAGLVLGSDSNFYGTASAGGTNDWGVVFKITPAGAFTNLYYFTGGTDGGIPEGGLVQGSDGNFYGTTLSGGSNGLGVVFSVTPAGTLTTLWQFSGGADGAEPEAGLVQINSTTFLGTTSTGTTNQGTVFKITSAGTLTTLWQFSGGGDGGEPVAGLVQGFDGRYYGTTSTGGTNGSNGTVFKISTLGLFSTVYRFFGGNDGGEPDAGLMQGSDSNFYGTAAIGGSGNGVVFKLSTAGTLTTLHKFAANGSDGANPEAGLLLANDGLFYGTASGGGTNGNGVVFRISSAGVFTNLFIFDGESDGGIPVADLVQGIDGNFYGTTSSGGIGDNGNVFKLSLTSSGGSNTLTQITAIQVVGTNVIVTLPSQLGESYQLQVSALMSPTNWSPVAGAVVSGTGSPVTLTNVGGALLGPQQFYRVDISP